MLPKTLSLKKRQATARVLNTASNTQLDLTVTPLADSFRLRLDEPSKAHPRFQVPDILLPSVGSAGPEWSASKQTAKGLDLQLGDASLRIAFKPFSFELLVGGKPAMRFNERQLFDWEHHRAKQVSRRRQCRSISAACADCSPSVKGG